MNFSRSARIICHWVGGRPEIQKGPDVTQNNHEMKNANFSDQRG